jgi:hypothetical protein
MDERIDLAYGRTRNRPQTLTGSLFRQILQRIERLGWHPT